MYVADIEIVPRNYGLVVSSFLFTTMALLAVIMRIYTRSALVQNVGADDVLIVLAALGTLGFLISVMEQIRYGLGDGVDYAVLPNFLQSLYSTIIAYTVTHFSVKFSILFQCRRIFKVQTAQRLFLGLILYLAAYGLFCFSSTVITCWPIAKYWNDSIAGGCIDRMTLHYVFAGINIFNDIVLLVSPMPFLSGIQIARRAKYVLIGVFACGGFACIVAIIRLHALYINNSSPIDLQPVTGVDIALRSGLEINVAILCACVPALKPLFVRLFPRLITSFSDSAKRSRENVVPSRDRSGNIHLRSFEQKRNMHVHSDDRTLVESEYDEERGHHTKRVAHAGGIEIKVQKDFEASSTRNRGEDDVVRNAVAPSPSWQLRVSGAGKRESLYQPPER
ncbi:uncharacterized protein F5Z01DRAFT_503237 [Emericellopsis atlantica]|uniref:Rhodopsin domain-containing protein n=1 Tax=Emericellopsis atlantica TaxID=2614577 RepID=A0A9P8CRM0_9HYPO|nr:uncharacterized protein F5Z01DRAFT_503237 [Emericellopsis atlantica]KAG9256275.1 hypothetical protein F5Z01DRAFT_503237 [Emericellopsis atlantica]